MTKPATYFDRFFAEKDIPVTFWEIDDGAYDMHIINSEFVIDLIKGTSGEEAEGIMRALTLLDFKNASIVNFLELLARNYIKENFG